MAVLVPLSSFQQLAAINLTSDLGNMAGKVKIPNAAQIRIRFQMATAKIAVCVLYGRAAGIPNPSSTQAQAIFASLTTGAPATAFLATQGNTGGILGVDIRSVHEVDQPLFASTGALVPGTAAGQPLPNEVAVCVTLRTALAGRANRGRMYLPNFTQDSLATGQVIAATTVTAINNWANTIFSALSGQGYTWVIGQQERAAYTSPKTGAVFPHRDATTVVITSASCRDNHWDSQRRRGLK